jgi:ABC-type protease/lipase transport system fused ATPase/permease subunit
MVEVALARPHSMRNSVLVDHIVVPHRLKVLTGTGKIFVLKCGNAERLGARNEGLAGLVRPAAVPSAPQQQGDSSGCRGGCATGGGG